MKICFLHYYFKKDGIFKTVLNNILGLKEQDENIEFVLAGESFIDAIPDYVEKKYINWDSDDLVSEIKRVSLGSDILIIENPIVGLYPKATLAFKEFAEKNLDKKIMYRIHDFIDDRPHLFEEFIKIFGNLDEIYPRSNNVSFIILNSFDKDRLIAKGLNNVHIIPNSIIVSNLYTSEENALKLKKRFEEFGVTKPGERIISYPVRALRRKNIEEAVLITKLLNNLGGNYRLIVTLPSEDDYQEEIKALAEKHNVPCSIGEAHKFLDYDKKDKFTTADLFSISDLVISTSVREGFGFAFIEPWVAGTPLIGRKIPEVTKDFEDAGIDLNHLYDNSILHNSEDPKERMTNVITILSNPEKFEQVSKKLDIPNRIKKARLAVDKNREAIKKYYNHINIAKQLLNYIMSDFNKTQQLNF